jgi:MOSC domain-containing protein YiiM
MSKLISVNVGPPKEVDRNGRRIRTAIWKARTAGRVPVNATSLEGDGQADLAGHGGVHRAIMEYSYRHWADESGQFEPGGFGENLTISVLDESRDEIA